MITNAGAGASVLNQRLIDTYAYIGIYFLPAKKKCIFTFLQKKKDRVFFHSQYIAKKSPSLILKCAHNATKIKMTLFTVYEFESDC